MFPESIKHATGNIVRGSCKWYIFPNHQKYATETFAGLTWFRIFIRFPLDLFAYVFM